MRQQRERNWLRISYALTKIHWASDPHCPPKATRLRGKPWPLPVPSAVKFTVPLHTTIQYYSAIFFLNNWNPILITSCYYGSHRKNTSRQYHPRYPRVANTIIVIIKYVGNGMVYQWVSDDVRIYMYAHKIGAYLQRLQLDCTGARAEMSLSWPHMYNKTSFLMTIYDLVLQWQGKEDWLFHFRRMWAY